MPASGMETPLHVINVTTVDGLQDLIALSNIIEFASALDFHMYENVLLDDEQRLEIEAAMTRYRAFIQWFSKKFGLLIDGTWLNPTYLFKSRLVSFAATVCGYFAKKHATTQRQSRLVGITPFQVKKMFRRHIQICWPDLLPAFDHLLTKLSSFLYYIGPPIRIIRKTKDRTPPSAGTSGGC
jgi:hypothetical protein